MEQHRKVEALPCGSETEAEHCIGIGIAYPYHIAGDGYLAVGNLIAVLVGSTAHVGEFGITGFCVGLDGFSIGVLVVVNFVLALEYAEELVTVEL